MADVPAGRPPSLRRRFAIGFGLLFVAGAVGLRLAHYLTAADALERDVDVLLWSRLGTLKTQERFAPDDLGRPIARSEAAFLPDLPARPHRSPALLGLGEPRIDAADFGWFAGVWRRDGTLVAGRDLPAGLDWDPAWLGRLDTLWTSADGATRFAATAGVHDTVLVAGTELAGLAAAARRLAAWQVATFLVWVPLVLGVAWLLLARLLAPLAGIAATARRIRGGRFDERLDVARADVEYAEVAGTLNAMLDRLDDIRRSQARFNADVAHQLLNPVHAILLETDAAEARPREALVAAQGRVAELARRIERLCDALLTYARSAALDPERLGQVDLEPVVAAALERSAPAARDRGITLVPPASAAVVRGDAALLEEALVNLLANAVEHSPPGGRVEVEIDAAVTGCRLAVVDHGTGVSPEAVARLFERFQTGKPAGGHGIGLALARRILRSHGGDLVHEPTPGGGATFAARFPAVGPPA